MIIHASTRSRAFKRGSHKKVFALLGAKDCLSEVAGQLRLDAESRADFGILTTMYQCVFSLIAEGDKQGRIEVYDKEGNLVGKYGNLDGKARAALSLATQKGDL